MKAQPGNEDHFKTICVLMNKIALYLWQWLFGTDCLNKVCTVTLVIKVNPWHCEKLHKWSITGTGGCLLPNQTSLRICCSFNSCLASLFHLNENWQLRTGRKVYCIESLILEELFSCSFYLSLVFLWITCLGELVGLTVEIEVGSAEITLI